MSVVFYDLTTIGLEGQSELAGDVRAFGKSKDGDIARQFMLGVVQTAEGLPIAHRVWQGNTGETSTLQPVIQEVLAQFPVRRAWCSWPIADCSVWTTSSSFEIIKGKQSLSDRAEWGERR